MSELFKGCSDSVISIRDDLHSLVLTRGCRGVHSPADLL
jgi:hypothetical protein